MRTPNNKGLQGGSLMNIDDYRAMKAEQEQQKNNPVPEQKEEIEIEPVIETKQEEVQEVVAPETIEIDGQVLTIDEIKNGYMRQSDYTKKTQELKRKEELAQEAIKFAEEINNNPSVRDALSENYTIPEVNSEKMRNQELEQKYYDLLIEKEITELRSKYGDFNVEEVLITASENNLNDLDTAYHIVQSRKGGGANTSSIDEIKEQLRKELMQELQSQADTTTTINSSGGVAPIQDNAPKISAQESKVAKLMGLSEKEYTQWRDNRK